MKKIFFLLTISTLLLACGNKPVSNPYPSGSLADQLQADYHRFGVSLHSYEFFDLEDTPAPKGYRPFYISHYGRHGSRSNWGDKDYQMVISILDSAKTEGVLTDLGETLLSQSQAVLAAYNYMDGRLTDRGEREHAMLATRLYNRYPEVWDVKEPRVISVGSLVPRSIISMTSFTNTLSKLNSHISYDFDCGEQMQKYIDCTGPREGDYKDFKSRCTALEDSMLATLSYDSTSAVARLFTSFPSALQGKDIRRFQKAIYYTCVIAQDFDLDVNVLDYLAFETAYYYNMQQTLYIAVEKRNTIDGGLERMHYAQIAVDEIIASADTAIATFTPSPSRLLAPSPSRLLASSPNSPIVANLRFGHDYPLLYIVNRMDISGVGDTLRVDGIPDRWFAHLNICMASNLQLIFYRPTSPSRLLASSPNSPIAPSPILLKVLYNERECQINGLTPVSGPYYRWADVKAKWQLHTGSDSVSAP